MTKLAPAARSIWEWLHACPLCAATALHEYTRVPSLFTPGHFIRYDRCRDCGVVFRNPRIPPAERLHTYEEQTPGVRIETDTNPKRELHYRYVLDSIRQITAGHARPRLLDFGCGTGAFLHAAQRDGFDVVGLELNRALANHVTAAYGVPVHQGLLEDAAFAHEQFGVIYASQVLEHMLDPAETVGALRAHLTSPGLLVIEVPNLDHVKERIRRGATMDDAHLFYFNARSLTALLERAGLRIVDLHDGVRPYSLLGESARRVPRPVLVGLERLSSRCRIRSGLSVFAVRA